MEIPWGELWNAAKLAGPFGTLLMLVMWWLERVERIRVQKEQRDDKTADKARAEALLERVITGLHDAATAVRSLKDLLQAGARRE